MLKAAKKAPKVMKAYRMILEPSVLTCGLEANMWDLSLLGFEEYPLYTIFCEKYSKKRSDYRGKNEGFVYSSV
jgi:hypothetical protein